MLFVELPKRPTPPEILAIEDPEERYEAASVFVAKVGVERFAVPRDQKGRELEGAELEGFVEGQRARLAAEAVAADAEKE